MKRLQRPTGVTLIELLVAMTLMVTIVSAVYGSYVAVANTRQGYQERLVRTREVARTLDQIAALVRGTYQPKFPGEDANTPSIKKDPHAIEAPFRETGNHQVTWITTARPNDDANGRGLWETTLRFDPLPGQLRIRQTPYVTGLPSNPAGPWEDLCDDVVTWELSYNDGRQWYPLWKPRHAGTLPHSVRIDLGIRDEKQRTYTYRLIASPVVSPPREKVP